jgi:hypothetical protein
MLVKFKKFEEILRVHWRDVERWMSETSCVDVEVFQKFEKFVGLC